MLAMTCGISRAVSGFFDQPTQATVTRSRSRGRLLDATPPLRTRLARAAVDAVVERARQRVALARVARARAHEVRDKVLERRRIARRNGMPMSKRSKHPSRDAAAVRTGRARDDLMRKGIKECWMPFKNVSRQTLERTPRATAAAGTRRARPRRTPSRVRPGGRWQVLFFSPAAHCDQEATPNGQAGKKTARVTGRARVWVVDELLEALEDRLCLKRFAWGIAVRRARARARQERARVQPTRAVTVHARVVTVERLARRRARGGARARRLALESLVVTVERLARRRDGGRARATGFGLRTTLVVVTVATGSCPFSGGRAWRAVRGRKRERLLGALLRVRVFALIMPRNAMQCNSIQCSAV